MLRLLARSPGQPDRYRRPLPRLGLQRDRPAMGLDELLGERQAQADRRGVVAATVDGAMKAVEDRELVGRCDAAAIVGNDDPRLARIALGMDQYPAALARVGNAVGDDMGQRLAEPADVAGDHADARIDLDGE